jgi:RecB family exonuclease
VAALRDCPLRWFLDRRVGAGSPSGGAAVVGLVVHAVAEAIARGDVAPDEREIRPFVDEIWASVPFPAHYQRVHERQRVDEMITALLAWDASTGRSVAATELTFDLPVAAASRPVHVSGSIDRVDRAEDGSLHVVDFKTGRTAASAAATAEHPQLGIYQLAIRLGALDSTGEPVPDSEATGANGTPERLVAGSATGAAPEQTSDRGAAELLQRLPAPDPTNSTAAGGTHVRLGQAELVHLADRFASGMPKVRIQAPLDDGWTWVNDLIVDAARLADGPDYPARPNGHCKSCAFRFMCPAQSPSAGPLAANPGPAAAEPPSETERSSIPTTAESAAGERPVPAPGEPADGDAGGSSHPATTPIDPGRPARPPARKRPALPDAPVQQSLWGEDL